MLSSVRLSVDIGFISFRFYFKSEELHISQCDLIRIIPLLFDSNRQLSTIGFFCPSLKKKICIISSFGKISTQPHPTLCIQFLNRENNDKNNTLPLGKQICFTIVWGCAEILPFFSS